MREKTVADQERVLGPNHPDTPLSRSNLALAYWKAGRTAEAIQVLEKTLADSERVLGPDHPVSAKLRVNLARATEQAPSGDSERRTRKNRWFRW